MCKNCKERYGFDLGSGCSVNLVESHKRLAQRLDSIADIINSVDLRCMAVDGPVTPTLEEMTQDEMTSIWNLATGKTK